MRASLLASVFGRGAKAVSRDIFLPSDAILKNSLEGGTECSSKDRLQ